MRKSKITSVKPGEHVFVDLRCYHCEWYRNLGLPDADHVIYVVQYEYLKYIKKKNTMSARCDVFDEYLAHLDGYWIAAWGSVTVFDVSKMILIDRAFTLQYPNVLEDSKRERLLRQYQEDLEV